MSRTRILIAEARFYPVLADQLLLGVTQVLDEEQVSYQRLEVPGSFELPLAVRLAIECGQDAAPHHAYDGIIALGCVIEGETDHYDHICREVSRALMDVATSCRIPLGFGLLTCRTYAQAEERASVAKKNKGADVARACLHMIQLKRALLSQP